MLKSYTRSPVREAQNGGFSYDIFNPHGRVYSTTIDRSGRNHQQVELAADHHVESLNLSRLRRAS